MSDKTKESTELFAQRGLFSEFDISGTQGKLRVVIFDDNACIRLLLGDLFERRGYEVFAFSQPSLCPLYAVQKCPCPTDASCADVIISDVNMHRTNGIDFLEQLMQKGCRQRNAALISGSFSEVDLARGTRLGCRLFNKPLDMKEFTAWVEEVERSIPSGRRLFDWQ